MIIEVKNKIEKVEVGDLIYCEASKLLYLIIKDNGKYGYVELTKSKIHNPERYNTIENMIELCFGEKYLEFFKVIKAKDVKLSFEY